MPILEAAELCLALDPRDNGNRHVRNAAMPAGSSSPRLYQNVLTTFSVFKSILLIKAWKKEEEKFIYLFIYFFKLLGINVFAVKCCNYSPQLKGRPSQHSITVLYVSECHCGLCQFDRSAPLTPTELFTICNPDKMNVNLLCSLNIAI